MARAERGVCVRSFINRVMHNGDMNAECIYGRPITNIWSQDNDLSAGTSRSKSASDKRSSGVISARRRSRAVIASLYATCSRRRRPAISYRNAGAFSADGSSRSMSAPPFVVFHNTFAAVHLNQRPPVQRAAPSLISAVTKASCVRVRSRGARRTLTRPALRAD